MLKVINKLIPVRAPGKSIGNTIKKRIMLELLNLRPDKAKPHERLIRIDNGVVHAAMIKLLTSDEVHLESVNKVR